MMSRKMLFSAQHIVDIIVDISGRQSAQCFLAVLVRRFVFPDVTAFFAFLSNNPFAPFDFDCYRAHNTFAIWGSVTRENIVDMLAGQAVRAMVGISRSVNKVAAHIANKIFRSFGKLFCHGRYYMPKVWKSEDKNSCCLWTWQFGQIRLVIARNGEWWRLWGGDE